MARATGKQLINMKCTPLTAESLMDTNPSISVAYQLIAAVSVTLWCWDGVSDRYFTNTRSITSIHHVALTFATLQVLQGLRAGTLDLKALQGRAQVEEGQSIGKWHTHSRDILGTVTETLPSLKALIVNCHVKSSSPSSSTPSFLIFYRISLVKLILTVAEIARTNTRVPGAFGVPESSCFSFFLHGILSFLLYLNRHHGALAIHPEKGYD